MVQKNKESEAGSIKVALSADEAMFWIAVLWFKRNYYIGGTEDTAKARARQIGAIDALVLGELGIKAVGPTQDSEAYRRVDLDDTSLLRRVQGTTDRRAWTLGKAEAPPRFEASLALTDAQWDDVLLATMEACVKDEPWDRISSADDYSEERVLFAEYMGGIFYALREASPRNRDLFAVWSESNEFPGVPYAQWRRLILNRWIARLRSNAPVLEDGGE